VKTSFDTLLRLLHPFMPFITEELHHALHNHQPQKACIVDEYPVSQGLETPSELPLNLVTEIRMVRNSKGISPKETLNVVLLTDQAVFEKNLAMVEKLANARIQINVQKPETAVSVMVGTSQAFIQVNNQVDLESEKKRIEEEISYLQGFMKSVDAKLLNEKFVANAKPEIVEKERQKKADAQSKIEQLQQQLSSLG
jgi:valyl-tRNA synthetase